MPSAADVAEDGLNLTSLCMALLQKIEELTLYLFEQDSRITALERAVGSSAAA